MAQIVIEVRDCLAKRSPECTKTFQRTPQRGRPPVACPACRDFKAEKPKKVAKPKKAAVVDLNRTCPCGTVFQVTPGLGRKPSKCDPCREAGTVYRADEDGVMQAIRAEALAEEQRELREQAGRERAERLCKLMEPLLKSTKERKVIVR
jgi:hypothetical protein